MVDLCLDRTTPEIVSTGLSSTNPSPYQRDEFDLQPDRTGFNILNVPIPI